MSKDNILCNEELLTDFPKFELSYENISHKKVHDSDVMYACPEGPKLFAWFTVYKDENVCLIFDVDIKKTQQVKMILAVTSFSDQLVYGQGTILYGTTFKYNEINCFCIEDIYYYKGSDMSEYSYLKKLQTIRNCLEKELCSNALTNKFTIFGLPIFGTNFGTLLQHIDMAPYKIDKIQFRYFNSRKILFIKYYKPKNSNGQSQSQNQGSKDINKGSVVFKVTPQIQTDIYNLFACNQEGEEEFFSVAFIPDYKTSVLMNKLFRNIKENRNLDALEESDDEEEFENEREDKYVFLDKCFKMNCQYNHKFKKWVPISLAAKDSRVISSSLL